IEIPLATELTRRNQLCPVCVSVNGYSWNTLHLLRASLQTGHTRLTRSSSSTDVKLGNCRSANFDAFENSEIHVVHDLLPRGQKKARQSIFPLGHFREENAQPPMEKVSTIHGIHSGLGNNVLEPHLHVVPLLIW